MSDIEKTYLFYGSGMNSDDDFRYTREGDGYTGRKNITISKDGSQGIAKTLDGNKLVFKALPSAPEGEFNKVVGAIPNVENKSIVYFVYSPSGNHRVFEYFPFADRIDTILKITEEMDIPLTSKTEISGVVIDNICYFNIPQPKVINLKAGLISSSDSVTQVDKYSEIGIKNGIYELNGEYYQYIDDNIEPPTAPKVIESTDVIIVDEDGNVLIDAFDNVLIK